MEEQKQPNKINLLYQDDIKPDIKKDYTEEPKKGNLFKWIIILIIALAIVGIGGYFIYNTYFISEEPIVCTEETKVCPDGSSVGRIAPDCEFAECSEVVEVNTLKRSLIVENFTTNPPFNRPVGPDTIYILEGDNIVSTIKTNLNNTDTYAYQLVEDRIYFYDIKDNMVKWIDFDNNMHFLDFTKVDGLHVFSFLISSDNQKIVWIDSVGTYDEVDKELKANSKMILANIDGSNKKIILEKNIIGDKHLELIRWSNLNNNEIYFTEDFGGRGGYVLFSGWNDLSKINIQTGETKDLFDKLSDVISNSDYISDISPNEKFIAYFKAMDNRQKLVIRNIETNEDIIIDIPLEEGFNVGGNAYFSPDNKHLVYDIAHWEYVTNEYYRTIVIDTTGENKKTIVDNPTLNGVEQWFSNDKIIVKDSSKSEYYVVDIDGSNFKKIETVR